MTRPNLSSDYTLIVPTFNRPALLARLLRSLERQNASFPILVLDSSDADAKAANRITVGASGLAIRYFEYDSSLPPFEKFWRGATEVTTRFCSLCADDDILIVSALGPILDAFGDDGIAMAHGWYFNFYLTDHLGLTSIAYKGDSIVGPPLARVRALLRNYEALTYGVYRSDVMVHVLGLVRSLQSILFREIGAGVFSTVRGAAVRVPQLYYGRALGASQNYADWHPIEFLIGSPSGLFSEYSRYRALLIEEITRGLPNAETTADMKRMLDLFHLRYLSEYLKPQVVDHVIDGIRGGRDRQEIMTGIWPLLQPSGSTLWDALRRSLVLRKLRERLKAIKSLSRPLYPGHVGKDLLLRLETASGIKRESRLYHAFLTDTSSLPAGSRDHVVATMSGYE